MNIKNYTSGIPVDRTVARIEQVIASAGASGIMKDYEDGRLVSISFRVNLSNGQAVSIRLPANPDAVYTALKKHVRRPRSGTMEKLKEQADRTAWKLMQDWVEVQISLIKMQQVDFIEVFLPYVWDGTKTFYASIRDNQFAQLPEVTGK